MKRILFMHQASTIGGGSYCLLNILKELNRAKIEPIACLASDGPLKDEIEKLGIEVIIFTEMNAVPYNRTLWSVYSVLAYYNVKKSTNAFKELLNANRIDVVYLNNMMIYPYLKPAKECGCKTILHCREHWPLDEHTTQLKWARNAVYQYADKLIAINNYSASIFPEKQATIVYDWIDMDSRYEYRPMSEILGEDATDLHVYLFTGGLLRIKGAKEVISTFSKCVSDQKARLLILGYDTNTPFNGRNALLKKILYHLGFDINEVKCRKLIKQDPRVVCIPSTYMITHIIEQSYCMLSFFTIPHANLALAECIISGVPVLAARTEESEEYSMESIADNLFEISNIKDFQMKIRKFNHSDSIKKISRVKSIVKDMMSKERNSNILKNILYNL